MSEFFGLTLGSANRKMVALRLADFADDGGRGIWPTVARVAAECEISESTVQRVLRDFVAEGILVVVKAGGGGRGTATRYDFDLARVRERAAEIATRGGEGEGRTGNETRGGEAEGRTGNEETIGCQADTLSADGPKGVSHDVQGVTGDGLGCHGDTRTIIEPPEEPPVRESARESGQEASEPAEDRKSVERAFEKAWQAWPTSISDSRPSARKAWMALDRAARDRAAADIGRYVEAAKAAGRKHICSIGVYLAEKRWEGLPPAQAQKPADLLAQPFGALFGGVRMRALLRPPGPLPKPSLFIASLIERDDAVGRRERLAHQARNGWPSVNRMHDAAANGKPIGVAPELEWLKGLMAPVRVGSVDWNAWREEHEKRGWPWLPDPGRQEWVYMPAGGPAGIAAFDEAVKRGRDHEETNADGHERHAAE